MAPPFRLVTNPGALAALFLGLSATVVIASPAQGESPTAVTAELDDDGVFVAADPVLFGTAAFDPAGLARVVDQATDVGLDLVIIAPADPAPDPRAFALRVRQAAGVDAVLLFGPEGEIEGSVAEPYTDRAVVGLEAARAAESPVAAAEAFLEGVTTEPGRSLPGPLRFVIAMVVVMMAALGGTVVLEQSRRRRTGPS